MLEYACDSDLFFVNVIQIAVGKARCAGRVPIVSFYRGTFIFGGSLFELRLCNQMIVKIMSLKLGEGR